MWHKAIKKLVCSSAIFFSSVWIKHTEALEYNKNSVRQLTKKQIKFEPQIGIEIVVGSLNLGLSVEYKFLNWLEIPTVLADFQSKYFLKSPNISKTKALRLVIPQ